MTKKQYAIAAIKDLVADFLDRKEDQDLNRDDMMALLTTGKLTESDIVQAFATELAERFREMGISPFRTKP